MTTKISLGSCQHKAHWYKCLICCTNQYVKAAEIPNGQKRCRAIQRDIRAKVEGMPTEKQIRKAAADIHLALSNAAADVVLG